MSNHELLPPLQLLTPTNHGPAVVVFGLIACIIAAIAVSTRLLTRLNAARKLGIDDLLITLALTFSVAQTACVVLACNHGLGRHLDSIDPADLDTMSKALYASSILLIATLAFAKSSVICLIIGLGPPPKVRLMAYTTLAIIIAWSVSGILARAFQCALPHPWQEDGQCVNLFGIDIFNCAMNIVTDLALIIIPAWLMREVQIPNSRRVLVAALFASRLIVIPFMILAITTRRTAYSKRRSSNDYTWDLVHSSIYLQFMLALSIMTACLPSMRRFLSDLRSGLIGVHISEPLEALAAIKNEGSSHSHGTSQTVTSMSDERDSRASTMSPKCIKNWSARQPAFHKPGRPCGVNTHGKSTKEPSRTPRKPEPTTSQNFIAHTVDYEVVAYQQRPHGQLEPRPPGCEKESQIPSWSG